MKSNIYITSNVFCLVTLSLSCCVHCYFLVQSPTGSQRIPSRNSAPQACARNAVCKYAICLHRRLSGQGCIPMPFFIDDSCTCPRGQICGLSDDYTHQSSPFFVYQYRCRHPAVFHDTTS